MSENEKVMDNVLSSFHPAVSRLAESQEHQVAIRATTYDGSTIAHSAFEAELAKGGFVRENPAQKHT